MNAVLGCEDGLVNAALGKVDLWMQMWTVKVVL